MISDENEMMWKKTQSHFICQISGKISSTQFDLANLDTYNSNTYLLGAIEITGNFLLVIIGGDLLELQSH
jgi:hypothetical protein